MSDYDFPGVPSDFIITAEPLSGGHPDKVWALIADFILDAHLVGDLARVTAESALNGSAGPVCGREEPRPAAGAPERLRLRA